jgi:hypothetical protein
MTMGVEVIRKIGAPYERSDTRNAYRNGYSFAPGPGASANPARHRLGQSSGGPPRQHEASARASPSFDPPAHVPTSANDHIAITHVAIPMPSRERCPVTDTRFTISTATPFSDRVKRSTLLLASETPSTPNG